MTPATLRVERSRHGIPRLTLAWYGSQAALVIAAAGVGLWAPTTGAHAWLFNGLLAICLLAVVDTIGQDLLNFRPFEPVWTSLPSAELRATLMHVEVWGQRLDLHTLHWEHEERTLHLTSGDVIVQVTNTNETTKIDRFLKAHRARAAERHGRGEVEVPASLRNLP